MMAAADMARAWLGILLETFYGVSYGCHVVSTDPNLLEFLQYGFLNA